MKIKSTLQSILPISVICVFFFVSCSHDPDGERLYQAYDPSEHDDQRPVQGIHGALDHYAAIRGEPETGEVHQHYAYNALQHINNNMIRAKNERDLGWIEVGPDNIGGRTRAFAIDIDDPNILYAGAVSGGFWKSTNRGKSWSKFQPDEQDDRLQNIAINCMEQTSDGTIYFGTGEQNFTRATDGYGGSGVIGMGVWKSEDRGETFQHLESTAPSGDPGQDGFQHPWNNVNMIKSDPDNPERIFAGSDRGLRISDDGGETWVESEADPVTDNWIASDVRVSPSGETVFVVRHNRSMTEAILYRSTQRGEPGTFEEVGDGLNPNSSRMVLAIAPSDPDIVYISSSRSQSPRRDGLEAVYKSVDNGENFEVITEGGKSFDPMRNYGRDRGQGDYDNIIAVDPYNPERIFLGGVHYWKWNGSNVEGDFEGEWRQIAGLYLADQVSEYYVHADKHEIVFDTTRDPYIKYITTDGGITSSRDAQNKRQPTYTTLNRGYATVQFYAIAASYTGDVIGGTQDNGTILVDGTGDRGRTGYFILGGDGAYSEISRINPDIFFYETQYGGLRRSNDRGETQESFFDDNFGNCTQASCSFVAPFRLWETLEDTVEYDTLPDGSVMEEHYFIEDGNSMLFFGKYNEIWVAKDPINMAEDPEWFQIADITPFEPRYMEYTQDGNTLYVGGDSRSSTGVLYRITGIQDADMDDPEDFDYEAEGIEVEQIASFNNRRVVGLALDPNDEDRLIVTLGNYGSTDYIYYTENASGAADFESIHGQGTGAMPQIPIYDAVFSTLEPDHVVLATEFGAFATDHIDGSNTQWYEANISAGDNRGMERVASYMIRRVQDMDMDNLQEKDSFRLYIGTHGRGVFMTNKYTSNPYQPVAIEDREDELADEFSMTLFPNPASEELNIRYESTLNDDDVTVHIYDLRGSLVESYEIGELSAGLNTEQISVSDYSEGVYILNLQGTNVEKTQKFMVRR